ncbi:MAG TPA: ribose ABC transporter permease [Candidatus Limnocylindria bacterium]|nr:ribose ABC transporter permease [Candidatus Limnocylindria bacterium]
MRDTHRAVASARAAASRSRGWMRFLGRNGILLALVILLVIGAALSPHFLTVNNLANVARNTSIVGILGIGMTFVILTRGIDLSVGSMLGFTAIVFALVLGSGVPWPLAIALTIVAGGMVGALNGLGITKGRLQPFIMTLGMLVIARGVTMSIVDGKPQPLGAAARDVAWLGTGTVAGVPVPVLIFAGLALFAWFVLRHTTFGRQVYAVGDNPEAARLSGISTNRVIFSVYVISGMCAAVAALIEVTRLATAVPSQGTGAELDAIAIVVIGGTSLFGGEGGVGGTVIGAAIIAAVNNLLNLLGVSPFSQQIVKGLIIVGAVFLERRSRREEGR